MAAATHVHYKPGDDVTGYASEVLAAARLVKVNGAWADGANLPVEYCDGSAALPDYITGHDAAAIGDLVHLIALAPGMVVELESSATIAAGALIKCTTDGKAAAGSAAGDIIVGKVLRGGDDGDRLMVRIISPAVLKIA